MTDTELEMGSILNSRNAMRDDGYVYLLSWNYTSVSEIASRILESYGTSFNINPSLYAVAGAREVKFAEDGQTAPLTEDHPTNTSSVGLNPISTMTPVPPNEISVSLHHPENIPTSLPHSFSGLTGRNRGFDGGFPLPDISDQRTLDGRDINPLESP